MGACASAREKMKHHQKNAPIVAKKMAKKMKEHAKDMHHKAREHAALVADKAHAATGRVSMEQPPTKQITQFEFNLAFRNIKLDEFEKRVKKLVTSDSDNQVSIKQLQHSFKDAQGGFIDMTDEHTTLYKMMTSDSLK